MTRWPRLAAGALALAALVPLAVSTAGAGAGDPPTRDAAGGPAAANELCKKIFTTGTGATKFRWCFSNDGNVASLEHPAGHEHIDFGGQITEGYILCADDNLVAWDLGNLGEGGFAPPSGTGNTVIRNTMPAGFRLTQTFASDTANRTANITMALKKTTAGTSPNVELLRIVDLNVDNSFDGDEWLDSDLSAAGHEAAMVYGLVRTPPPFARNTIVTGFASFPGAACSYTPVAGDFVGDGVLVLWNGLGDFSANQAKTAKFALRVDS